MAGVARGNPVEELALVETGHGRKHFVIDSLSAAAVGGLLKAFQRDGGDKVFDPQHLVGKGIVDQGAVGKAEEDTVRVYFAEVYQVFFADQRFSACVDVHIDAHLFALTDDVVDFIEGQIQFVAVFSSPASRAVQIAGTGGIEKNSPRDVTVIFLSQFIL